MVRDVNIDIASDSDTFGDTFVASVLEILLQGNIAIGIGDYFLRGIGIDYWQCFYRVLLT